jgi:glycosyl transferase family 25
MPRVDVTDAIAEPAPSDGRHVTASLKGVFYINRGSDTARRVVIERGLEDAGLDGERILAVEGLLVPPRLRPYFFTDGVLHSRLTPGEVGCYASHLAVMQLLVDRDLDSALVLEDDATLPGNVGAVLSTILVNLPSGWDVVHLCRDPCRATKHIKDLRDDLALVRYSRVPATTTGYLISRSGAQKFLRECKRYWPVDTDFRQPWRYGLEIYGLSRKLIYPNDGFTSSIHAIGGHSRLRRGPPIPNRYSWTGNPLHSPLGFWFNLRRLGLKGWTRCAIDNGARRAVRAGRAWSAA